MTTYIADGTPHIGDIVVSSDATEYVHELELIVAAFLDVTLDHGCDLEGWDEQCDECAEEVDWSDVDRTW